jgi:uncharacterized protein DUF6152
MLIDISRRRPDMKHVALAIAVAAAVSSTSLSAHHSYSAYDTDRLVEVQGVLEEFDWRSPHSLIKVKDEEGRLYIFEWQATGSLQRRGIQEDTLKRGDHLVITGNPHRDFETNRILNFKSVKRPADGWKWPSL